jgi:nitrate/nitrite transporter NarK
MTLSGFPPLQILVWPEFFGRMHIGSIIGVTSLFTTIAGALGPVIAGVAYDQTGSYEVTIWMLVVTWVATAGVMMVVKPASHREDPMGVEPVTASRG